MTPTMTPAVAAMIAMPVATVAPMMIASVATIIVIVITARDTPVIVSTVAVAIPRIANHDIDLLAIAIAVYTEISTIIVNKDEAGRARSDTRIIIVSVASIISVGLIGPGPSRAIDYALISAILSAVSASMIASGITSIFTQIGAGRRIKMPLTRAGRSGNHHSPHEGDPGCSKEFIEVQHSFLLGKCVPFVELSSHGASDACLNVWFRNGSCI
jgi:hypothetical protein